MITPTTPITAKKTTGKTKPKAPERFTEKHLEKYRRLASLG
jgi:hypothetical protein